MAIIDDRTPHLNLPLPHKDNKLQDDVGRIRAAISGLDGLKADLVDGKVPASQLPSYVDDVLEFDDLAAFPATGESGAIYIALDTDKTYRWSGSTYAVISDYTLPAATASTKGGIRVGSGLSIGFDGQLSVIGGAGSGGVPAFNELLMTPSTNGQTVFNPAGGYGVGMIEVIIDGVSQFGNGEDYIADDGVKITLLSPVNTTQRVLLRRWTTSNNFPFSALTDKPTTLAGYGITDAATDDELATAIGTAVLKTGAQTVGGEKTFTNPILVGGELHLAANKKAKAWRSFTAALNTGNTNWITICRFAASNKPMYSRFLLSNSARNYSAEIIFSRTTASTLGTVAEVKLRGAHTYYPFYPSRFRIIDLGDGLAARLDMCFLGTSSSTETCEILVLEDVSSEDRSGEDPITYPFTASGAATGVLTPNALTMIIPAGINILEARINTNKAYAAVINYDGAVGQAAMESNTAAG